MKRLLTSTMAVLLLLALAGASGVRDGTVMAAGDGVLRLDLRTAVELAYEGNVELLLAKQEVERARLGLEQVRAVGA